MHAYSKQNFCIDIMSVQKEVTGSCLLCVVHYPNGEKNRFIVDCGMFQEPQYLGENDLLRFNPENFNFAMLTHNHADHSGRFPLMVKKGFNGPIHTTKPTAILLPSALRDTEKIDRNRRKVLGKAPLITTLNVSETLSKLVTHEYKERFKASENIFVTLFKNGHLPGAAVVLVEVYFPGFDNINVIFTGDYNDQNPFFEVPELPERVLTLPSVTVVQECTYGENKKTECALSNVDDFEKNIVKAAKRNASILIPALSQGRTQDVLLQLKKLQQSGELSSDIPVILDGKLSTAFTMKWLNSEIGIRENMKDFLPQNFIWGGKDLRKKLIETQTPSIVVASSGMGSHGPAQEYILNYLQRNNALIQFTSYQAEGTAGRILKESNPDLPLQLYGRILPPRKAQVEFTRKFSSHATPDRQIAFLKKFENLKVVLLNHGSFAAQSEYGKTILEEMNPEVGVLGENLFRVDSKGIIKTIATKFL